MLPPMLVEIMVITVGCFVAALVNAALATGGVYIMLAASSAVLPLVAAIPMQAALAAPSLLARIVTFWPHIHWRIFAMFAPASAVGVLIGAQVFVALDEGVISVALGGLLLLLVWGVPKGISLTLRTGFCMWEVCGFFGTLFGVGLFLQPSMLRTQLNRLQITGTLAMCLVVLEGMKATSYIGVGFDYSAYWPHILAGAVAGIAGNITGHRLSGGITERHFRIIFKLVVTLAGLRLLAKGVVDLGLF